MLPFKHVRYTTNSTNVCFDNVSSDATQVSSLAHHDPRMRDAPQREGAAAAKPAACRYFRSFFCGKCAAPLSHAVLMRRFCFPSASHGADSLRGLFVCPRSDTTLRHCLSLGFPLSSKDSAFPCVQPGCENMWMRRYNAMDMATQTWPNGRFQGMRCTGFPGRCALSHAFHTLCAHTLIALRVHVQELCMPAHSGGLVRD